MRTPDARPLLVLLLAGAALAGCAPSPTDATAVLDSAELLLGEERPDRESIGQSVSLPDRWYLARRRQATQGWYRFEVEARPSRGPLGLLAHGARLNAEFFFNGESLGRVGRFEPPIARSPGLPLYFHIPDALVRPGTNTVEVRLATTPGFPGRLDPIWVGPRAELQPAFARLSLVQVQLPRLGQLASLLLALGVLAQALTHRPDRSANLLLGSAAAAMAIAGTSYVVSEIPVPSRLWEWFGGCAVLWASLLLVLSAHRFLELERAALERRLLATYVAASAALAAVPYLWAFGVWVLWLLVAIGVYVYLIWILVRGARCGQLHPSVPIVAFLAIAPWMDVFRLGLAGTALLATALALVWFVVSRTFLRLRLTEDVNRELEQRVAEREEEVRQSYERLRVLERAQAVAKERERLMRDMHDGTGGQLTSALALARIPDGDRDTLVGILQEALDDLRLTIESLDPAARDLPSVLGIMRATLERRLVSSGLRLVWQVGEAGAELPLGSEAALHVIRIVQEAVTNTIKHAAAEKVTILTGAEPSGALVVEVRDDGRGTRELTGGRGVGNMRERAAAMGGSVEVCGGSEGTLVRLVIPPHVWAAQSSERTSPS